MKQKLNFVKMINKINIFLGIIIKGKKMNYSYKYK